MKIERAGIVDGNGHQVPSILALFTSSTVCSAAQHSRLAMEAFSRVVVKAHEYYAKEVTGHNKTSPLHKRLRADIDRVEV